MTLLGCACLLTSCGLFQTNRSEPCDCGVAEKELRKYTLDYFSCLEDVGVLRHELKAERERR